MLTIYKSRDLFSLAKSHLHHLKNRPKVNPLLPKCYVVQNHDMARWLSLFITEREGIATNMQFNFPAELYWRLIRVLDDDIAETLPSERLPMTWAIFYILQTDDSPKLFRLQQYVNYADGCHKQMRCWDLARRIGDIFDQYLTYRPHMLLAWERGKHITHNESEHWQAVLWNKLNRHWHGGATKGWEHRAALQQRLCKAIDEGKLPTENLPRHISIFGVSEMPKAYLTIFLKLSKCLDVSLYRVAVSGNSSNTLVHSLGKAGADFEEIIQKVIADDGAIDCQMEDIDQPAQKREDSNLFNVFKQHLLEGDKTVPGSQRDNSIQVHACHSPRREAEVLYDQLLKMFDEDESLNPCDVLILCPQMERYAPEIETAFGAPEQTERAIPFNIADSRGTADIVFTSFLKLLDLADSRFKVTDVLDFLDAKPVRHVFSFTEEEVRSMERWIGDTRIRWGINAEQKGSLGLPESNSYTWQSGLQRMFAGYAMEGQEDTLFQNIFPYSEIQHAEQARLLGRFSGCLHHLFNCYRQAQHAKKPAAWSTILNEWLHLFYTSAAPYTRSFQKLEEVISMVKEHTKRAGFDREISFRVVRSYLHTRIDKKSAGAGRSGQGVTFIGMIPMRSIPAKVIGMIGMSDGAFPRIKPGVEFDLIKSNPEPGDRLSARDDRQLFLEMMMAARCQIYFSYVGQSNKKDIDFPSSVVLQEVLDYLSDEFDINEKEMVQKHKLHAFSPDYFKNDKENKLFSYSRTNEKIARKLARTTTGEPTFFDTNLPEPEESFKHLTLAEVISFFQHPAKYLLKQRLGIYIREDEILDEDREVFKMNALEKYTMDQELMDRFLHDRSLNRYAPVAKAQNLLPEGWPGEKAVINQAKQVKAFGQCITEVSGQNEPAALAVDFESSDFHITGQLEGIYPQRQLLYRVGKKRAKDLIKLWIRHLLLQVTKPENHPGGSRFYALDNKKKIIYFQLLPVKDARKILGQLLQLYWRGMQHSVLFFPGSSYAYAKAVCKRKKDEGEGIKAAKKKWVNSDSDYPGEADDPYNKRIMRGIYLFEDPDVEAEFKREACDFWAPFFEHMKRNRVS